MFHTMVTLDSTPCLALGINVQPTKPLTTPNAFEDVQK